MLCPSVISRFVPAVVATPFVCSLYVPSGEQWPTWSAKCAEVELDAPPDAGRGRIWPARGLGVSTLT